MHYVHMYTGADGLSHFREVEVSVEGGSSALQPLTGVLFRHTAKSDQDWHNAPRTQFIVAVSGSMVLEVPGEIRTMNPGDIVLADDLTGQGHKTRFTNAHFLILPVAEK